MALVPAFVLAATLSAVAALSPRIGYPFWELAVGCAVARPVLPPAGRGLAGDDPRPAPVRHHPGRLRLGRRRLLRRHGLPARQDCARLGIVLLVMIHSIFF